MALVVDYQYLFESLVFLAIMVTLLVCLFILGSILFSLLVNIPWIGLKWRASVMFLGADRSRFILIRLRIFNSLYESMLRSSCSKHFTTSLARDYPLNLSISLSGGKETNKDFPSNCEWRGKSPRWKDSSLSLCLDRLTGERNIKSVWTQHQRGWESRMYILHSSLRCRLKESCCLGVQHKWVVRAIQD